MNMFFFDDIEQHNISDLKKVLQQKLHVEFLRDLGKIPLGDGYTPDGYFEIKISDENNYLLVESKGHVEDLRQIQPFLNFSKKFSGISFLVAAYISLSVKKALIERGIGYFEIDKELNFSVRLKKDLDTSDSSLSRLAGVGFQTDSLTKILFYLSVKESKEDLTQRDIAASLGISLGAVNKGLHTLQEKGFIEKSSLYKIRNKKKVFKVWTNNYFNKTRKKLSMGRFSPIVTSFYPDWQTYNLASIHSYWGSEPAVRKLNRYLTPGFYTIYTYETKLALILKTLKLKPDPLGKIEILKAFWPEELNNTFLQTVPDFLVLSDLIGSGIDRNAEAAEQFVNMRRELGEWL